MERCKEKMLSKEFITKLPSYSPLSILLRFIVVSIVASLSIQFILQVTEVPNLPGPTFIDYIIIICAFNLLGESNIILDIILEKFLPIPEKIKLRVAIHSIAGVTLIVVVYKFIKIIFPDY